jgi:acetyl esterase/lipase
MLAIALATALVPAAADAGSLRDSMRVRAMARMTALAPSEKATGGTEYAYGADPLQRLDYWRAGPDTAPPMARPVAAPAPLILFVHGGAWRVGDKGNGTGRAKVDHWRQAGYAVASINYRLVPAATVEQQAQDVAASLAWLVRNAARLGIDPARIVLAGHSAGAQLVALVGTDPAYLAQVGLPLTAIRGVVALDGAAYDVPGQSVDGPQVMQPVYAQVFGTDAARQRALSPTLQAAAPNAPAFLLLHVQRPDGIRQAQGFADALRQAGTPVTVQGFEGVGLKGHMEIHRRMGEVDYPATAVMDAWLKTMLAPG